MTYPVTASDLERVRNDMHALRERSYALESQVRDLQWVHDHEIKAIIAEHHKRETAKMIRPLILIGILWALDLILMLLPAN
jgi:hypothetical protein